MDGWMDGWVDGWVYEREGGRVGLRTLVLALSCHTPHSVGMDGWMDGWMREGGREEGWGWDGHWMYERKSGIRRVGLM
jgi:hypothetical protein